MSETGHLEKRCPQKKPKPKTQPFRPNTVQSSSTPNPPRKLKVKKNPAKVECVDNETANAYESCDEAESCTDQYIKGSIKELTIKGSKHREISVNLEISGTDYNEQFRGKSLKASAIV